MIEKLQKISDKVFKSEDGEIVTLPGQNIPQPVFDKINELVDAVNKLQKQYDSVCIWVGEQKLKTPAENVQDKFAEQRNWFGKMCRFWNEDPNDYYFDILKEISCGGYIPKGGFIYSHCEPVKPDDDIIYKGGDNDNT